MPVTTLFVGIDVSLKTNQVCSINFNQDVFFNQSFDNSPSGTEKIVCKLLDVLNVHPELTKIHICMEATNVYHIHVSSVLSTDARLLAHGVKVFAVNAKLIEKYKETFVDRSKTDPEDAFLCADYVRIGKCKDLPPVMGYQKIALQRLTRQRKHIAEQLGIEKQYLSSNLYLKFSALKVNPDERPFSNIYGKTSTKEEDIYLSVANKHFAEGEDGRLIIFDHNGVIDSARSVELQGTNGDIHVTDEIKAALNLDVKTTSQGNIYFDRAVDSAGNVSAKTDTGNITASRVNAAGNVSLAAKRGDINFASAQAKNDVTIQIGTGNLQADSIISDQSIRTETGRGDTNIALVDAANVSIFMGDNSSGSSLGAVRANATGGVSDVALGGNYISVGTVKAKNGGSALVVFTQGATRGQASDDITINSVSAPGGTIMPQVWSNTGSIYVAEGNFRASKVYALDNMRFANNKVRVGLYGNMNNFDRTIISYFNDTSENRPQDHLSDWFSGSYSDRRWLYVDLSEEGNVRSRYGKLINSNGYRYLDTDNISVADNMQNMLDRWFPMGTGLVYFDRYGLIYYEGLAEDNKGDKFVVEN